MEIRIQIRHRVFSLCIGHETKWFAQMPLVSLIEEFYDERRELYYAEYIWSW